MVASAVGEFIVLSFEKKNRERWIRNEKWEDAHTNPPSITSFGYLVGPPPGLSPVTAAPNESISKNSTKSNNVEVKMAAPKANRYEMRFMLALSSSPLVAPPKSMPDLNQWYG
jgi:hypothetical protein